MDTTTVADRRLHRVGRRLWDEFPENLLVVAYRADRGVAVEDFCTDLAEVGDVIEGFLGQVDSMKKILRGLAALDNSTLELFSQKFPESDLWISVLPLAQMFDVEIQLDKWLCPGCDEYIQEGEHFIVADFGIRTRVPPDYRPPVDVPPTQLEAARVHNPNCLVIWMANSELLTNVFG